MQGSEFARVPAFKIAPRGGIRRNSLLISLLAGNSRGWRRVRDRLRPPPGFKILAELLICSAQIGPIFSGLFVSVFLPTGAQGGVCTENLDSNVVVMKSTKDRVRFNASDRLNRTGDRRIFIQ